MNKLFVAILVTIGLIGALLGFVLGATLECGKTKAPKDCPAPPDLCVCVCKAPE